MPTQCVPTNHCGTHAPGWLSGGHPTVAQGLVHRNVCFHWTGMGCCEWSSSIRVANCNNTFYVYELSPPPACYLRYCGDGGVGMHAIKKSRKFEMMPVSSLLKPSESSQTIAASLNLIANTRLNHFESNPKMYKSVYSLKSEDCQIFLNLLTDDFLFVYSFQQRLLL